MGIISYWNHSDSNWARVPDGSIVVINPESGILDPTHRDGVVDDIDDWKRLVKGLRDRNVSALGYVPTGHFNHTDCPRTDCKRCESQDRISKQVAAYHRHLPSLQGLFFDETSPYTPRQSADFAAEFSMLRNLAKGWKVVFNVGGSQSAAVEGACPTDELVLYESPPDRYDHDQVKAVTSLAAAKGIAVWHLILGVREPTEMRNRVELMRKAGARFGFVSSDWNSMPSYWDEEVKAFIAR
jgi:hypothetical protein